MSGKIDINKLNCFIDLHLHLDGSLSLNTVKKLAMLQNIEITETDDQLKEKLSVDKDCKDLNQYLSKFAFPCSLLQTKEAITLSVKCLNQELSEQGLMYTEIRFAPQLHINKGLTQKEVVEAAIDGLKSSPIPSGLILCCMRGEDNKALNIETVRVAKEFLGKGVVAVDLAGAEAIWPVTKFEEEIMLAHELGIPYTLHAGEATGPEEVKNALNYKAKRIGHGINSYMDNDLMERLRNENITLECCPTSNLQTRAFDDIRKYPIRLFLEKGVKFTINTDNTVVSNTSIQEEWDLVIKTFSLNNDEIKTILLNAVTCAFTTASIKEELIRKIEGNFSRN